MIRVLVTDPISIEGIEILKKRGLTVDLKPNISGEQLKNIIPNYHVLIVRSRTKVTREIISAAKNLVVIGRAGVGLDNIDLKAAEEKGIKVLNTPAAPTNAVAELTIGLMITLARKISLADSLMKAGEWPKHRLLGIELKGKTLGIIGFGRIGRRVARLATPFQMKIIAYDIADISEVAQSLDVKPVERDQLLRKADFITLHLPLLPETWHMMDWNAFKIMKKGVYIINTSRGGIIDENALLRALEENIVAGAALDVYEVEPPTNKKLISNPRIVCTPHIGAMTAEAQRMASMMISENIISFLEEQNLLK